MLVQLIFLLLLLLLLVSLLLVSLLLLLLLLAEEPEIRDLWQERTQELHRFMLSHRDPCAVSVYRDRWWVVGARC